MENNQNYQEDYDEISLKELIQVLLKEKFLIVGITLVIIVLAAIYSLGILKPTYKSEALLTVKLAESVSIPYGSYELPESMSTPYGSYELPFTTVDEYAQIIKNPMVIQRTINDVGDQSMNRTSFLNSISVETLKDTHSFKVKLEADSPEKAYQLLEIHVDNYLDNMELLFRQMAVEQFYNQAIVDKRTWEKSLLINDESKKKAQELLAETPKAIDLENALISEAEYALIYSSENGVSMSSIAGDKIISQEVNPSYQLVLEHITNLGMERNELENGLLLIEKDLVDLQNELDALVLYRETYSRDGLAPGVSDAMKNLVVLTTRPVLELQKTGPRNALNLAIGGVLGLMIGVFVAFFKNYWQEN